MEQDRNPHPFRLPANRLRAAPRALQHSEKLDAFRRNDDRYVCVRHVAFFGREQELNIRGHLCCPCSPRLIFMLIVGSQVALVYFLSLSLFLF